MMSSKTISRALLSICLLLPVSGVLPVSSINTPVYAADQHLYASPTGTVNSTCSLAVPCTLEAVRDKARTLDKSAGNVVINLRGGTYTLAGTFELTESATVHDSGYQLGGTEYYVIYQAYQSEVPVISGGQEITGWTLHDAGNNIYKANAGSLQTRTLFVNDVRATRAQQSGSGDFVKTATGYTAPETGIYSTMENWVNPDNIEFVYLATWKTYRCQVSSIAAASPDTITMKSPCFNNSQLHLPMDIPYWIENAYELLDATGEWYLDETGAVDSTGVPKIYYKAPSGETMSGKTVVAGKLEKLVAAAGSLDYPIHHIQFKNITFAHTTWSRPSGDEGYISMQAGLSVVGENNLIANGLEGPREYVEKMPAAVSFAAAKSIALERNTFTRLGAAGVDIEHGSSENTVVGNTFIDISGSGIQLGDIHEEDHHLEINIAGSATVTSSSEWNGTTASDDKATDDVYATEWSSTESDPWIQLTWSTGQTMSKIRLRDKINATDNINGGTLTFSDSSTIVVTGIPTGDRPKEISFAEKTGITWVKFQAAGGSGSNNGLADFRVLKTDSRLLVKDHTIQNNFITRIGKEYFDAVGIWVGHTENTLVDHNDLLDLPYSAISLGWGWGMYDVGGYLNYGNPTINANNKITNNLIYDFMKVLADGGGIYTLSSQPGEMISGNVVRDMQHLFGAYYLDDKSRYQTVVNNIAYANSNGKHFHLNANIGDIVIAHNFWDSSASVDHYPPQKFVHNTNVGSNLDVLPASILNRAGLEEAYQDLHPREPKAETTPPTAPANVTALVAGGTNVHLSWTASTDNVGVTGYEIYQDSTVVGVTTGTSYTVKDVDDPASRSFSVKARDAAANLSDAGSSVSPATSVNVNLALNKSAAAFFMDGSAATMQNNMPASHAVDGNSFTAAQASGQWRWQLQVDLGGAYRINHVVVKTPVHTYATEFDIKVSTDGANFTTVASVTGFGGGISNSTFASVSARYVRIVAVKPDDGGQTGEQMAVSEVEVYENLALGKPATAYYMDESTATMQDNMPPSNAVDGSLSTAAQATNQFRWQQQVDLGAVATVNRIITRMPSIAYASEFDIKVSTDGTNFTTLKTITEFRSGTSDEWFPSVSARYVRITAIKPDGGPNQYGGQMSISELEVYGNSNLALGKTAHAYFLDGSTADMQGGSTPAQAVDGNYATVSQASGQYAWQQQVDLGTMAAIDRVTTHMPPDRYATEYDIKVSSDGSAFTTLESVTGFTGGASDVTVAPTYARYVRIVAVKPDGPGQTGGQMGISELEVFGKINLALNQTAAAYYMDGSTAVMQNNMPASNAVDGNPSTAAQATYQIGWQQQVDLGATKLVSRVVVKMLTEAYAQEFDIKVSTDGTNFTTVKTVAGFGGGISDNSIASTSARYIRIVAPHDWAGQMAVSELEVY